MRAWPFSKAIPEQANSKTSLSVPTQILCQSGNEEVNTTDCLEKWTILSCRCGGDRSKLFVEVFTGKNQRPKLLELDGIRLGLIVVVERLCLAMREKTLHAYLLSMALLPSELLEKARMPCPLAKAQLGKLIGSRETWSPQARPTTLPLLLLLLLLLRTRTRTATVYY